LAVVAATGFSAAAPAVVPARVPVKVPVRVLALACPEFFWPAAGVPGTANTLPHCLHFTRLPAIASLTVYRFLQLSHCTAIAMTHPNE
jgi:hypothetical protein